MMSPFSSISIHSPHARGDQKKIKNPAFQGISIHSPHARGDRRRLLCSRSRRNFNPLPSCEGRRFPPTEREVFKIFQSTPLMRGETRKMKPGVIKRMISIHSPHARGDALSLTMCERLIFQSTPLMRGETASRSVIPPMYGHFNPLPSCEGRPVRLRL